MGWGVFVSEVLAGFATLENALPGCKGFYRPPLPPSYNSLFWGKQVTKQPAVWELVSCLPFGAAILWPNSLCEQKHFRNNDFNVSA